MSGIARAIARLSHLVSSPSLSPVPETVSPGVATPEIALGEVARHPIVASRTLRNGRINLRFSASERRLHVTVDPGRVDVNLTDEYRRIKRPLLANAFGAQSKVIKDGNLIAVTSSLPGEGKTFTSLNLALSMAMERDRAVLLVDGDSTKASLSKQAGLDNTRGLVDVLLDPSLDLADVIVSTDVPNFSILPAGQRHACAAELLTSNRMNSVLAELVSRYNNRVIIFDAPPVLATPEAQILCSAAGQIVFVVEAAKTSRATVEQALELIAEGKEKPIGLLFNKSRSFPGLRHNTGDYGYYG